MDRIYRVRNANQQRHAIERDGRWYWLEGDIFGDYRAGMDITGTSFELLAPVQPSKIMAIGLNYKDHAAEMKKKLPEEPLVFMKNLAVEGWVNGEKRQASNTNQLIFSVPDLVAHVSRFCTLEPGDVITTGTPSGVGPVKPGDRVMVKVEGVGALSNPCVEA